jgi:Phosphotransferase enzyme family
MNAGGDGFTLVLEDLAPAEAGDQIAGCSLDQARAAAVNVAGLHAPTWNDPSLRELDWLIPDLAAYPEMAAAFLVDATTQFLDRYEVTPDTAVTLRGFADRFVDWATGRPEPFAMLHSDYRLDNLLFAEPDAPRPVVAVDWQVVTVGSPLRDVAFLVSPVCRRRAGAPERRGLSRLTTVASSRSESTATAPNSVGRTIGTGCFKAHLSPCWARSWRSPAHGATGCSPSWPSVRRRRSPTWMRCLWCDGALTPVGWSTLSESLAAHVCGQEGRSRWQRGNDTRPSRWCAS